MIPTPIRTAARPAPFPVGARAWPIVPWGHHAVYRFFTSEGVLLYVGVSWNPSSRWMRHRRVASWWPRAAVVVVDVYRDERTALEVERHLIRSADPIYNVRSARS